MVIRAIQLSRLSRLSRISMRVTLEARVLLCVCAVLVCAEIVNFLVAGTSSI